MCHIVIGKVAFVLELKRLKKNCARAHTNKRAYNKVVKKLAFFEKYQNGFGVVIHHHIRGKKITFKLIKTEEDAEEFLVSYPASKLLKNKSVLHAEQA
jgi:hypothetical protein